MNETRSYDPGQPGEVIPEGAGRYIIESFKTPGEFYSVDLRERTCTCPDHLIRGRECKHQKAAMFAAAKERAARMTDAELHLIARQRAVHPEALRAAREEIGDRLYREILEDDRLNFAA